MRKGKIRQWVSVAKLALAVGLLAGLVWRISEFDRNSRIVVESFGCGCHGYAWIDANGIRHEPERCSKCGEALTTFTHPNGACTPKPLSARRR